MRTVPELARAGLLLSLGFFFTACCWACAEVGGLSVGGAAEEPGDGGRAVPAGLRHVLRLEIIRDSELRRQRLAAARLRPARAADTLGLGGRDGHLRAVAGLHQARCAQTARGRRCSSLCCVFTAMVLAATGPRPPLRPRSWRGLQTLPRDVSYDPLNDVVLTLPVPELSALRTGLHAAASAHVAWPNREAQCSSRQRGGKTVRRRTQPFAEPCATSPSKHRSHIRSTSASRRRSLCGTTAARCSPRRRQSSARRSRCEGSWTSHQAARESSVPRVWHGPGRYCTRRHVGNPAVDPTATSAPCLDKFHRRLLSLV